MRFNALHWQQMKLAHKEVDLMDFRQCSLLYSWVCRYHEAKPTHCGVAVAVNELPGCLCTVDLLVVSHAVAWSAIHQKRRLNLWVQL